MRHQLRNNRFKEADKKLYGSPLHRAFHRDAAMLDAHLAKHQFRATGTLTLADFAQAARSHANLPAYWARMRARYYP